MRSRGPAVPQRSAHYTHGMSRNGKVVVAMSGGVDSSVAACLLAQQGYECIGVFMRVGVDAAAAEPACTAGGAPGAPATQPRRRRLKHGCCSADDARDARAVAGKLGIPFYALNFQADFDRIIDYFADEYAHARTPNPCVMCNIHLKFGKLLRYADLMDAPWVATGHYARVVQDAAGRPRLARAVNHAKDQSYVLFGIRPDDLGRCLFPLGGFAEKAEVRSIAARLGLQVHDKPDSQEICFVPGRNYTSLVHARRPESRRRGELLDAGGAVVGEHDGVASFTIGQRRGLGVALGAPAYVTRLDVLNNRVVLGPKEALLAQHMRVERMNWFEPRAPGDVVNARAKIRHMHAAAPAQAQVREGDSVDVHFEQPQLAITPGQAAVLYDGADLVIGGGWIVASESPAGTEPEPAHARRGQIKDGQARADPA